MTKLSRRDVLLGASVVASTCLITGIPRTPLTPAMQLMQSTLAADQNIPDSQLPDYVVRLHANENPYGPSRLALKAITSNMHLNNRYSGPPRELMAILAKQNDVTSDHVVVGTGSDEILKVAGLLASHDKGSVLCVDPTFQSLLRYAEASGSEIIRVPVDQNLNTDLDAMRKAVRSDTNLVYLVNPNNPIPSLINKNAMREFVLEMAQDRMVFIDEAYHEYVDDAAYSSMMDLIEQGHKNIIISRTASKIHGLAGMRIGFGFAEPELAAKMTHSKTGSTHVLAVAAAIASYQDAEFKSYVLGKNRESQAIVSNMCEDLGLRQIRSNTNFAFIETRINNSVVKSKMKEFGILTGRDFKPYNERWSRISMGTPEEMSFFTRVFRSEFS